MASPEFRALADVSTKGAGAVREGNMALSRLVGALAAETMGGQP